ncbi:ankyrin-repeat protein [Murmansk poxvirus]|uniref:Ankyrin-repeat protein n=1 Tax=Murmansk poxvirus TaxID=2025359 RepID=A0A223FN34_9POXV|nr:ankyrin-repeat protein [Murmansk poxvirus]AST09390.1 ankyrin-repeat protein [Murmansk poxvirus]
MSGVLSLSEYATCAVRKLLYNIYLSDFKNRINTTIKRRNNTINIDTESESEYYYEYDYENSDNESVSGSSDNEDVYDYNKHIRHRSPLISKKIFYDITKYRKNQVYVDSNIALIDTIKNMILILESKNKHNPLIKNYKSFINNLNKKNVKYNIGNNEDMDILYTYFKLSKYSVDLEPELVKYMIDSGIVNINYRNKKTNHGILHAYLGNIHVNTDVLELLCNSGANINMKSNKSITPFHTYLRRSDASPNVVRKIIKLGGDIHSQCYCSGNNMTPIITYFYNVSSKNPEIIKIFIESVPEDDVQIMLHSYISVSCTIEINIIKLFLKYIKTLDYKDKAGRTLLHLYMLRHQLDIDIINLLHYHNENCINEPDNIGNTVLHTYVSLLSIISEMNSDNDIDVNIIKHLISLGADITSVNYLNETPLTTYICTEQNSIYYDIIDCLMSNKVLDMVKHRILQDVICRNNESHHILHYLITKYNLDTDLYTEEYEPYDYINIDDEYHYDIVSRYNNLVTTSGMTPLHLSIIKCCDNNQLSYLLSIQCDVNKLTKTGLNCLELTINNNDCNWISVEKILEKRPNVKHIVTFLNLCYDKGLFKSILASRNSLFINVLSLAIMLVGVDQCNKYIGYMEMEINVLNYSDENHVALTKLCMIRDNIDKLTKIYIDSRNNTTLYDILVSKSYIIDLIAYKENSVIASFGYGTEPLCELVRDYISEARSNYYITKDVINYLIKEHPSICTIPIHSLFNCIIGLHDITYFIRTIMKEQYDEIIEKLEHIKDDTVIN